MQNKPIEGSTDSSSPWIVTPIGSFGWLLRQGDSWFQSFEYILGFLEPAWHVIVGQKGHFKNILGWPTHGYNTGFFSTILKIRWWHCGIAMLAFVPFFIRKKSLLFGTSNHSPTDQTLRPRSQCLPSARDRWHSLCPPEMQNGFPASESFPYMKTFWEDLPYIQ